MKGNWFERFLLFVVIDCLSIFQISFSVEFDLEMDYFRWCLWFVAGDSFFFIYQIGHFTDNLNNVALNALNVRA